MNLFDYIRPASLDEALAAGAEPGASYMGGGTNLLDLMKVGVATPGKIVDITRLPGLDTVELTADGGLKIGANVRNSDLARDAAVLERFPMVAEALLSGASAQLRNAATVGGNLMQKTRCGYFFDPSAACNRRDPGAGCEAVGGETAHHAVIGWSKNCIATHPSDFCVPLAALDAVVEIAGPDGTREVPVADFHMLPGTTPEVTTALKPGELITALRLPAEAAAFAGNSRYLKLRERTSYAFALVSAAAALRIEGGVIAEARLALGAVAAKPWRVASAEALLKGATPGPEAYRAAAEAAMEGAEPSGDNASKIELAKRIAVRALTQAEAGTPRPLPALPGSVFTTASGAPAHV